MTKCHAQSDRRNFLFLYRRCYSFFKRNSKHHIALPPSFFLKENMLYLYANMVQFKIHVDFKNKFEIYIKIVTFLSVLSVTILYSS